MSINEIRVVKRLKLCINIMKIDLGFGMTYKKQSVRSIIDT